jgi:SAM-dependent methyltransferase
MANQSVASGYEKAARLYDLFDQKENVGFFLHYASRTGEVLDVGAGTGRIALPLAKRGVNVFCVEPSTAMREEFKKKLAQQPGISARIRLAAGKASSFTLDRRFAAAFLSGVFDHFLDDEERVRSLMNIGHHLEPGGILVFDVFLGLMKDSPLSPAGSVKAGGKEYRRFVGSHLLPGKRMETVLVFEEYAGGELVNRIEERSLVGLSDRYGVHRVLAEAGFSVVHEWSDYDFAPYQEGDSLLIVEAVNQKDGASARNR